MTARAYAALLARMGPKHAELVQVAEAARQVLRPEEVTALIVLAGLPADVLDDRP